MNDDVSPNYNRYDKDMKTFEGYCLFCGGKSVISLPELLPMTNETIKEKIISEEHDNNCCHHPDNIRKRYASSGMVFPLND